MLRRHEKNVVGDLESLQLSSLLLGDDSDDDDRDALSSAAEADLQDDPFFRRINLLVRGVISRRLLLVVCVLLAV
jgi:hypothetical protein